MILITLPNDIAIGDTGGYRRLRTHAAWYKRQVARHGPDYGALRFARRQRERTRAETRARRRTGQRLRAV